MKIPTEITFRDMKPSEEVETRVYDEVEKLQEFYGGIMNCRVIVEIPHEHQKRGKRFQVGVSLKIPGGEIISKRAPSMYGAARDFGIEELGKSHELDAVNKDVFVAIRDAFRSAQRQLKDLAQRKRGEVKYHETASK